MEDKLVLAQRSKKSLSRYIVSTALFIIVALVFYLITYVFKTVPETRIFTFTAIIALSLGAFAYYGFLLARILLLPSELIVLHEGELIVKGRVKMGADQVKDVTRKYGITSSPKFSYGRLVIVTKQGKRITVPEVEDVSAVRQMMHEVLGIE
ncbi:MAG: hypothetical protein HN389_05245 [Clostridia bacterium]|nr:hypothetical protein [Clostridia bacterium]